jgi:type I restriction enzyme S subunit
MHFVNSPEVRESIQSQASGTTRRRISGGNLKRLPIPVPPAEEQRRLVARLDSLRARSSRARQELDHIPKLIERYKQAILAKGFSGSDDAEEVALGDLIADGPQNGLYLPKSQYGDGTPILRIENYGFDGAEPMTAWSRVKIESDIAAKYALAPGDIVINRVNSPSHLGKSLLVLDAHVPAVFESNMMRMRLSDSVLPEYVQLFLGSEMGRKQLIADAKWAVNQASINQGDVCRIIVPLPSIATQSRVIAEIRVAMAWLDKIATEHARAEHLLPKLDQAVLAKAFRGELVPQDPNDEPASVLLERIKAARAGKAPEKRRRPKS